MISYCHVDKQVVHRIHQYLADNGFKIWIDRDNIYGPAMQAMADAIEESEFIILCMSDSYKRSVYCQAEAEYAFRCKRYLLPVVVRQGYRADGWLGLVVGSRLYVDFGKLEFKNGCQLILKEITLRRKNQSNTKDETKTAKTDGTTDSTKDAKADVTNDATKHATDRNEERESLERRNRLPSTINEKNAVSKLPKKYIDRRTSRSTYGLNAIEQWSEKDILDFLHDCHLYSMMPLCELMTGQGLIQLYRSCKTKPNEFYDQLNIELMKRFDGSYLPTAVFTQFLTELDQLFHSSRSPQMSSLLSSSEQEISPIQTKIPTVRNVEITEQTAYQPHWSHDVLPPELSEYFESKSIPPQEQLSHNEQIGTTLYQKTVQADNIYLN